jgi:hypothetical protein
MKRWRCEDSPSNVIMLHGEMESYHIRVLLIEGMFWWFDYLHRWCYRERERWQSARSDERVCRELTTMSMHWRRWSRSVKDNIVDSKDMESMQEAEDWIED